MNSACIIGYGVVGRATAEAFGIKNYFSRNESNITLSDAAGCNYIFICLPTPTVRGAVFTDDIYGIIKEIKKLSTIENTFIIRSTVYPGFNKFLQKSLKLENIVSNPEFLSEDTAVEDAKHPDLVVIGSDNEKARERVVGLYKGRFKNATYVVTDSVTAELIKYSLNGFFATKVVFANEIYDYAQKIKANYETIRAVLEVHKWGSKNHFRVFDKNGRGAGGKCLKKDLSALAEFSKSNLFREVALMNIGLLLRSNKA